jgi:VanZ family protein
VENNVRPRKWQWLWPLVIALLVIAASHRPRLASTGVSHGDKLVHFAVYGLLGTLVARLGTGWRGAAVGLLVASAFGVTDEFHQSFVPHRSSDVKDWVADTLGAALAVTL